MVKVTIATDDGRLLKVPAIVLARLTEPVPVVLVEMIVGDELEVREVALELIIRRGRPRRPR